MHTASTKTLIALALAAAALAAVACSAPQPADTAGGTGATAVPTSSAGPATSPQETATVSSGPVLTPASGTAARAAILDAATGGLGLGRNPTVIQLFSQGTAAVGDIQPADGSRMLFAVTGGPDAWTIAWSAPFGSSLANLADLKASAPLVSPELAAALSWTKKAPKPAVKAPTLASFKTFAMTSATDMAGTGYTGTFTITAKIVKDSIGVWWGSAVAQPSDAGLEPIGVWGQYSGGKWTGEIADFSSADAAMGYFPADVLDQLGL
jgi:hypothetical protein